ncbi:hypothetical protein GGX14DRAFT_575709 [Mycena pura]|uniref:Uncharacterized protein n=1 Tax=Mycena pura TaxID=153505 RepID=A0AAD6UWT7_9AGAR|nr:hypothetical protein GGX14DRAFT_575709 [Mycena pura]
MEIAWSRVPRLPSGRSVPSLPIFLLLSVLSEGARWAAHGCISAPPSLKSIPLICPRQLLAPNSFGPALFIQLLGALFSFHSVSFSSHRFQNYRKVGFAPRQTSYDCRQRFIERSAQVFRRLPLALSSPGAVPVSLSSHSKMSGVHERSRTDTLPYSDDVLLVPRRLLDINDWRHKVGDSRVQTFFRALPKLFQSLSRPRPTRECPGFV